MPRGARPQPEPGHRKQVAGRLQRQDQQHQAGDEQLGSPRCSVEAYREEEPNEQNVFEAEQPLRQFTSPPVVGETEADNQSPEIRLETDQCKGLGSGAHGQAQSEEDEQLAVPGPIQKPAVEGTGRNHQGDHGDRPQRRRLVDGHGEEDDGKDVLNDERADGDAAGERCRLPCALRGP